MGVEAAILGDRPEGRDQSAPVSALYGDVYHPEQGARAQAEHVFLSGNELPKRWQQCTQFVVLETGFGLGNNFLCTWAAWLADPQRCDRLVFVSVEKHPLRADDLARVHGLTARQAANADKVACSQAYRHEPPALAARLHAAWPPLMAGLHTLTFEHPELPSPRGQTPRVELMLAYGDVAEVLPSLMLQANAFYLDGFTPERNPAMWDAGMLSRLHRLAAPGATLATCCDARPVQDALTQAGFTLAPRAGLVNRPGMLWGRFEPRHTPVPLPGGLWPAVPESNRHAIVIGAGLAGCSAARALTRQGWRVTQLDAHDAPAHGASGNPGGLFHSILHGDDGIHARAHRAAALATWTLAAPWMRTQALPGQCDGLLRLDAKTTDAQALALLSKQHLGKDHVQWVTQDEACALAGIHVPSGGWLFKQGGWLQPPALARLMLDDASSQSNAQGDALLTQVLGRTAHRIARHADSGPWQVFDATGALLARAPTLVLANAHAAQALLDTLPPDQAVAALPMSQVRGQISAWPRTSPQFANVTVPRLPVAGSGYVLPLGDQGLLFGATTQHHDLDPSVRDADHRHNLTQAQRLGAVHMAASADEAPLPEGLQGRTGWRATTPDRLPLVGALPWSAQRLADAPQRTRLDQVRLIPRERSAQGGLYAITGLGSRGITWAPLVGELLAHWVTGSPCPVETELRDALDPARFLAREQRKPHESTLPNTA